jgi:hypothetical protein
MGAGRRDGNIKRFLLILTSDPEGGGTWYPYFPVLGLPFSEDYLPCSLQQRLAPQTG